jgi:enamine deaminase RidA (YjgF/YER057c/UK114 family)
MEIYRKPAIVAGQSRGYAKATSVSGAKELIWVSGCIGINEDTSEIPDDAGEQAKLVMKNIKSRLDDFGSRLENILFFRMYYKGIFPNGVFGDPNHTKIEKAIQDFWREHCPQFLRENCGPSESIIGVTSLARPKVLIEIEVVAAIG